MFFKSEMKVRVPHDWEIVKTGEICISIVPGRNKPKQFDGDIPWITVADVEGQFWIAESKIKLAVSREELKKAKGKTVPENTVIMACVGTFGVAGVAARELVINQQLHGFVCNQKVLPEYLCWVLRSKEKEMISLAGKTTILYLNSSRCESISIPLPPIQEQKRIVEILATWDEAIALTEKAIKAKTKRKNYLVHKLISQNWKELENNLVPIGEVVTSSQYGLSLASDERGNIPIIGMKDMANGKVLLDSLACVSIGEEDINKFCLQRGDILLNRTNSYDLVGKVAIYDSDKVAVFASYLVRFKFDTEKVLPEFINYLLNSYPAQQRLKKIATKGVSQANINPTIFKEWFLIPLIPLCQQKVAVEILKAVDSEIEILKKYRALLQQQKRGLMQKLLTGEWRVAVQEAA